MDTVEKKAREGKLEAVGGPEEAVDRRSADVIDLTELLKRSLAAKPGKARAAEADEEDDAPERRQPNPSQRARPRPASRPARHAHARHRRRAANQQEGQLRHGRAKGQRSPIGRRCGHQQPSAGDRRGQQHRKLALAEYYGGGGLAGATARRATAFHRPRAGRYWRRELLPASLRPVEDAAHARAAEKLDPEHARLIGPTTSPPSSRRCR